MDLYEILSLSSSATNEEITKAYRTLAKKYHPDKPSGSTEKFQQINYAYNILINKNTRLHYDTMKKPTKNKLIKFLEDWFKKQVNMKNYFNLNDNMLNNIFNNIDTYDFNDIFLLFNNMIIPDKKNETIDCSDTETPYWDETQAEYYNINDLPLKYYTYNINNIKLNLKCTIDDINNNNIRKIKIKRMMENISIETIYYFKLSHPIIVFNNGGDNNGHLIINLSLPEPHQWLQDIIYYNININLYEFIYGINIPEFNITNWLPHQEGIIINIKYVNKYIYAIKLNIIYIDNNNNKEILKHLSVNC